MCDYMDRDDQEMVNMQTEILQKAMQHHLHIQFHGAYHPTGTSRTYPNEFTREGTLNYENDKWVRHCDPGCGYRYSFYTLTGRGHGLSFRGIQECVGGPIQGACARADGDGYALPYAGDVRRF